jgi:4-alpha-glucanotransferase
LVGRDFIPADDQSELTVIFDAPAAVAVASNHDLPTLRSWSEASDLEVKVKVG